MKNAILEQFKDDPAYREMVQLYSTLFDTQDERETFILDVAEEDILLAAECKTSSVMEEEEIEKHILEQSFDKYNKKNNEQNITNYYLILLNLNKYSKLIEHITSDFHKIKNLPNKKNMLVRIVEKIAKNYKKNIFDMITQIIYSEGYDSNNLDIVEYFLSSLEYNNIDFEKEKVNILKISNKLLQYNSDLSFLFLLEKNTNYLLFSKSFIIDKVKEHFQKNKVFQITILWIKKYKINDFFTDEYVLRKIIETKYWDMVFDFIENSKSIDIKKVVLEIIDDAISNNVDISFIIKIGLKYNFISNLPFTKLIEYSLKQNNDIGFVKLIQIYKITDLEVIKNGIEHFFKFGKFEKILYLINKYSLESFFNIDYIFKNFTFDLYPQRLKELGKIYDDDSLKKYMLIFAKDYYNKNKLGLAEQVIDFYNLWSEFNFDDFIKKAFELKKWGLLASWYKKYDLINKYTINDIIQSAVTNNDLNNAYSIAKEFNLNFSDFYKISVGGIVKCKIKKIVKSRVFVKIEYNNNEPSIYIKELANKYIPNIFDFEYNGEKLHIGQELIAKVISIDEKDRINLSLKQVE